MSYAKKFLADLRDIKALAVPGNCDPRKILKVIDNSNVINLHGRKETINNITFVGLGGSNITPFDTPFELSEDEIFKALDPIMVPGAIMVLHFPVKGYLDEVSSGANTGSTGALKIVEKYKPFMVLSGHIHETRGYRIDDNGIIYLNPGPLSQGFAAIIDITPYKNKKINKNFAFDCKFEMLSR